MCRKRSNTNNKNDVIIEVMSEQIKKLEAENKKLKRLISSVHRVLDSGTIRGVLHVTHVLGKYISSFK